MKVVKMLENYPQLTKLGIVTAFALVGRWLIFAGSQPSVLLGCLIYVGMAVYLGWCVVRYFSKRR